MTSNGSLTEVDDVTFENEVLRSEVPVLVDFVASHCAPCVALKPTLERLAAETAGRLKIVTVDTEVAPLTATRYGIRAVPTLLVFKNGDQTVRQLGVVTKQKLLDLLER
jgi:thioredoxin 1